MLDELDVFGGGGGWSSFDLLDETELDEVFGGGGGLSSLLDGGGGLGSSLLGGFGSSLFGGGGTTLLDDELLLEIGGGFGASGAGATAGATRVSFCRRYTPASASTTGAASNSKNERII